MSINYAAIAFWAFAALIAVAGASYFLTVFNGLIQLRNDVRKAWADIDVVLKQRYDELPNVIAAVKGYMAHEKTLLEDLARARSQYLQAADIEGKIGAESGVSGQIKTLFAAVENYPDLKANQNFLQLQGRISGLEIELADRRELYNASVNAFNVRIDSLPDLVVARLLRLKPMAMFEATSAEQEKPDVDGLLAAR